ncbi:hypothetical protein COBT_001154 [Conglomerata obtusa]
MLSFALLSIVSCARFGNNSCETSCIADPCFEKERNFFDQYNTARGIYKKLAYDDKLNRERTNAVGALETAAKQAGLSKRRDFSNQIQDNELEKRNIFEKSLAQKNQAYKTGVVADISRAEQNVRDQFNAWMDKIQNNELIKFNKEVICYSDKKRREFEKQLANESDKLRQQFFNWSKEKENDKWCVFSKWWSNKETCERKRFNRWMANQSDLQRMKLDQWLYEEDTRKRANFNAWIRELILKGCYLFDEKQYTEELYQRLKFYEILSDQDIIKRFAYAKNIARHEIEARIQYNKWLRMNKGKRNLEYFNNQNFGAMDNNTIDSEVVGTKPWWGSSMLKGHNHHSVSNKKNWTGKKQSNEDSSSNSSENQNGSDFDNDFGKQKWFKKHYHHKSVKNCGC